MGFELLDKINNAFYGKLYFGKKILIIKDDIKNNYEIEKNISLKE
tara:strand:+ start:1904 stop:2038 length:135 start_codon:yes stop_codon:yes gene_type:complete